MTTRGRALTAADITRIRSVSDPQISPDGRRVAFVVTMLSEERDEYLSNVWVGDVSGGEPRRFTTGAGRDTSPRWSPAGAWLAFLASRDPKARPQLHVMPGDGGEPVRLTDLPHGVSAPVWAPDSARLAFVSRVGPAPGEGPEKSKPARIITTLKYRFNGEGFIHDRPPHVFVVGRDGGAPRQITDGDFTDGEPTWSPDGRWLAFTSARHADRDHDDARDLFVISADGGEPRRLTDSSALVTGPTFSPDGRVLAYVARRGRNAVADNHRLFTIPLDGGASSDLSAKIDRSVVALGDTWAVWSADGQWIVFAVEDGGRVVVHRVRSVGSVEPIPVVTGERVVSGFSMARDGALAFTASTATAPAEVFVTAADGSGERPLSDLNRAWREEVSLAVPERFRYECESTRRRIIAVRSSRPSSSSWLSRSSGGRRCSCAFPAKTTSCRVRGRRATGWSASGSSSTGSPGMSEEYVARRRSDMFTPLGLDHVVLVVRDQQASQRFYIEVLGCTLDHVNERISLVHLRFGEACIDLLPATLERPRGAGGVDHVCLSITCDDLEKVATDLRARGVNLEGGIVTRRGAYGTGPSLYLRDPDGYMIELKPR